MGFGRKLRKANPVRNFVSAGKRISQGDVSGAAKQAAYGLGKTAALGPGAVTVGGAAALGAEAYDLAKNNLNARAKAARDAQAKQQALADRAYGENAFSGEKYTTAQQGLMDDMVSGNVSTPTTEQVDTRMQSVVPQINEAYANNAWSTARLKAQTAARQQATSDLSKEQTAIKTSALEALRNEAANRSNTLMGKASMVQAKPTWMDTASDVMGLAGSGANTVGKVKAVV